MERGMKRKKEMKEYMKVCEHVGEEWVKGGYKNVRGKEQIVG